MEMTVSDALIAVLRKHGVRYVCGLPAAQLGLFMDGASRHPDLVYVTTRHEEAAGHMAASISRVTDTVGVCFATVGPGATNLVPGVAAAFADNIPIVVITGQNQSWTIEPGLDQLQAADQLSLFKPITKWGAVVHHARRAPELFERALRVARSGRPGPVHLDIPCDVGTELCDYDPELFPAFRPPRPVPCRGELEAVAQCLRDAKRPLLLAGGGVARSGAVAEFRGLVDACAAPALSTANGRGVLDPAHPLTLGSAGLVAGQVAIDAAQEADLVFAVGCKFSTFTPVHKPPHYPKPDGQLIVQIDIDAESIGRSAPVDHGLVGDARETLGALLELLQEAPLQPGPDRSWVESLLERRDEGRENYRETARSARVVGGSGKLNESAVASALAELAPRDSIFVHDGGQAMMWTLSHIQVDSPERSLFVPGMGHLGFGLPYANAAKLAHPDRPVFCLTGDGALGMTIQELETAVRYGLNVVIVVFNDSYWGMYKPFGEMLENPEFGTRLSTLDFTAIARGFGCHAETVSELEALPTAVAGCLDANRPALLNVTVDFTPHPMDFLWPNIILDGFRFPERAAAHLQAVA